MPGRKMGSKRQQERKFTAMQNSKLLGVVVVLQSLTLVGQWVGPSYVQPAAAQVPDAGAQRIEMISELSELNDKFDKLIEIMESGDLQVRVAMPDEKNEELTSDR
jgi:hypothetical protein